MKQKHIAKINKFLREWDGASVSFNRYVDDHDRLTLLLVRPNNPDDFVGIILHYCVYISGSVRWKNGNLICESYKFDHDVEGFALKDTSAGFRLLCCGPIVFGSDNQVVPQD